jgi:hypothetical protein
LKIIHIEMLQECGRFSRSGAWKQIKRELVRGVGAVQWPPRSGRFTIYPELGRERGKGNGVKPIKEGMMQALKKEGWALEVGLDLATRRSPGKLDAVKQTRHGPFAVEWETGNISSSHRALNKMAIGLLHGKLSGGMLVVPSRNLYRYLTDRIGNFSELEPYLDLWRSIPCSEGVLGLLVVEHDGTSTKVRKITKGTDGRALA